LRTATTQPSLRFSSTSRSRRRRGRFRRRSRRCRPEFVADYADKSLAAKYADWESYKDRAAGWLAQNSYLITDEVAANPNLLAQRLEVAYKAVKADDLIAGNIPAAGPDTSAAKQAAQTMSGASVRQPTQADDAAAWAKIAGAGSPSYAALVRGQ
jgi:hypothetical protein